ncbi:amidohydrolase family protein [Rhodococcus sp. G-MC3]|uniref:amidohydrolase n=1 Tax=Rhodococcus sp. G-MC3 TaxID=3046209 RepID=UPI0024B92DE3|nr:amidohydrolase family protein [Rhodococcus sp. G-MC3]MDJ0395813.1 amidohydrolase family protein [Rhodococcus sp. G-MC3]
MSSADLIIHAASVHTLDDDFDGPRSVAVCDGLIVAVGDAVTVRHLRSSRTEEIDLGGGSLTPGLVDGHIHPVMGLNLTFGTDLSTVTDLDGLRDALLRSMSHLDRGEWIRGWGLNPNVFGDRPVTHAPLVDAVGSDIPVFLEMFDAHSALASPAALALAGVDGPRTFEQRSEIVCDADGVPTGHLLELAAMGVVRAVLPLESPDSRRARLLDVLTGMAAVGITAGNAMDFETDSGDLMLALEAEGELPMRLRFAPFCLPGSDIAALDHITELQRRRGRRWRVDGVKFMIDGTIDGGTAWLDEPDTHGESTVPFWPEPDEYRRAATYLAGHGVPLVTHAIGDAGVRYALDTLASCRPAAGAAHHRIEHIETLPDDLVPMFARHQVVASMQPTHCTHYTRADQTDNWSSRLGPERADRAFRTRDIRDAGGTLALGSDWPVAPYDPRAIMADAQLRRPAGRPEVEPVRPEQMLTARMALEGYTTHAAAAAGESRTAGRIAVGMRADLTAFAVDPLAAPPDELADAPILLTTVGGSISHYQR